MTDAFYVPDGAAFASTEWTRGPWGPDSQHAGPPSALVARAFEELPGEGFRVARFTLEILRPIPVAPLRVDASIVRPGRRVQYAEAGLWAGAVEVARATSWRLREATEPNAEIALDATPHPAPEDCPPFETFHAPYEPNYLSGMEWRSAKGAFLEPGPAVAWARMRIPLVSGESPSPLTRVLALADSGNGISATLPIDRFIFINTELTVHLVREPEDEWVCLDAITRIGPGGAGLAQSVLWDRRGRIGAGAQVLLVARRSAS
jgi:hypothetical protein